MEVIITRDEFAEYVSMKTRIGILMCLVAEEDEKRTKGNCTYPGSIDTTRIRQVLGMPQFVHEAAPDPGLATIIPCAGAEPVAIEGAD